MPTVFLSYALQANSEKCAWHLDPNFVLQVSYWLRAQGIATHCYHVFGATPEGFGDEVSGRVVACDGLVLFQGHDGAGAGQLVEHQVAVNERKPILFVRHDRAPPLALIKSVSADCVLSLEASGPQNARQCAHWIISRLRSLTGAESSGPWTWSCDEDLPLEAHPESASKVGGLPSAAAKDRHEAVEFPFLHEKEIMKRFLPESGPPAELVERGCPPRWPSVPHRDGPSPRDDRHRVVLAAANSEFPTELLLKRGMVFDAASEHDGLPYHRKDLLKVGILVSGGIAPGINAVISGIVEQHLHYVGLLAAEPYGKTQELNVFGYLNGFNALKHTPPKNRSNARAHFYKKWRLDLGNQTPEEIKVRVNEGGSLLGTSRADEFLASPSERATRFANAVDNLTYDGIDILYVIGGDGSMRAAHALWQTAKAKGKHLAVVGIPKTIDNDILWVWQSFGFQSAAQQSKEIVDRLWTEVESNPRLAVVQLFGSNSGFVVADAASASRMCDVFLTPEMDFRLANVAAHLHRRFQSRNSPHGLVIMAETAVPIPSDARRYLDDSEYSKAMGLSGPEREALDAYLRKPRISGQTPDALRSGALKLVANVLGEILKVHAGWNDLRVLVNEPRHLIRSQPPSSSDIVIGRRLGAHAVDGLMAGYEDFMVSHWLTEYVRVPLKLVVLGRKRMPQGAFQRFAVKVVGQPADLTSALSPNWKD